MNAAATGGAAREVARLRTDLAAVTHDYVEKLDPTRNPQLASATVERLRADLARANLQAIHEWTSSDAVIATLCAAVHHKRDLINAYEDVMGSAASGAKTTEFNVHTRSELISIRNELTAALASVEKARHSATTSIALDVRQREIEHLRSRIDTELAARRGEERPVLMTVDPALTLEQAHERSTDLAAMEADGYVRHLRLQVELRSQGNSRDPHLAILRDQLIAPRPPPPAGNGDFGPDGPWPSPPATLGEKPRPPPSPAGRAEAMMDRLVTATHDELIAFERGDLTALARARGQVRAYSEWLRTVAGHVADVPELAVLTDGQLLDSSRRYSAFLLAEERAPQTSEIPWKREVARIRSSAIRLELERRALATDSPIDAGETLIRRVTKIPLTPQRLALERRFDAAIAGAESLEAQKLVDIEGVLHSRSLGTFAERSQKESLRYDVRALTAAWEEIQTAPRDLLISGRGASIAQQARAITATEVSLRSAAAALQERISAAGSGLDAESAILRRIARTGGRPIDVQTALRRMENLRGGASRIENVIVEISTADVAAGVPYTAERITAAAGPLHPEPATQAASPKEFKELFPAAEQWTRSEKGLLENLGRAPGGIIIDPSIPSSLASQIEAARVDPTSGRIDLRLGGRWCHVQPQLPPGGVRAAWAYVTVGSAVAIDLRPLDPEEAEYLAAAYSPNDSSADEKKRLADTISDFISVNLNPAVVATRVGRDLIVTDELIFDLLPLEDVRDEKSDVAGGLDIRTLREKVLSDRRTLLSDPHLWSRTLKSIITFSRIEATVEADEVALRPVPHFLIAAVPAQGTTARAAGVEPLLFPRSSEWFDEHRRQLSASYAPLRSVSEFAAVVAILRTVVRDRKPNNFDVLIAANSTAVETPRFLCRARSTRDCNPEFLHQMLERR
jgi:hypothetical protein